MSKDDPARQLALEKVRKFMGLVDQLLGEDATQMPQLVDNLRSELWEEFRPKADEVVKPKFLLTNIIRDVKNDDLFMVAGLPDQEEVAEDGKYVPAYRYIPYRAPGSGLQVIYLQSQSQVEDGRFELTDIKIQGISDN